jgi:hypothetical protein
MSQEKSNPEPFGLMAVPSKIVLKGLRAIQQSEGADPQQYKREKYYSCLSAVYARCLGRNPYQVRRQEELLHDARHYALRRLMLAVSKLKLPRPASEADVEAACDQIRDRLVLRVWEHFLPKHKDYSDCQLEIREFEAALWTEGCPSLEDRASAAIQERAASGSEAWRESSAPAPVAEERNPDASQATVINESAASRGLLDVSLISTWMDKEGWINKSLAKRLGVSERAISSLRNNGSYHGTDAITKLANLMNRNVEDLYLP